MGNGINWNRIARVSVSGAALTVLVFASVAFSGTEVAKVNGHGITDKELESALGGMNEGQRENFLKDPTSRRQVLQNVIDQELLIQEAEKEKLDQEADYKDAVSAFRRQYLASKVLQKNLGTKLTNSAAKKYFAAHKNRFSADTVHAQHILVATEEQARELAKKAKEPNTDFQELAEKFSKDPSAKDNRGDLGFFNRERMVPEFTEPVFEAAAGEIVGPIKTAFGYHVVKVIEKKIGKTFEFDEVEMKVQGALRQELAQSYLSKLRAQAKVTVNEKALEK